MGHSGYGARGTGVVVYVGSDRPSRRSGLVRHRGRVCRAAASYATDSGLSRSGLVRHLVVAVAGQPRTLPGRRRRDGFAATRSSSN